MPPSTAKFDVYTDAFYQISNPSAGLFIAVGGSGLPALSQPGLTTAQGQYQIILNIGAGTGSTLADWPASHAVPDTAVSDNPGLTVIKGSPVGFDTVTLVVPQAVDTRKFGHLKVVTTP